MSPLAECVVWVLIHSELSKSRFSGDVARRRWKTLPWDAQWAVRLCCPWKCVAAFETSFGSQGPEAECGLIALPPLTRGVTVYPAASAVVHD